MKAVTFDIMQYVQYDLLSRALKYVTSCTLMSCLMATTHPPKSFAAPSQVWSKTYSAFDYVVGRWFRNRKLWTFLNLATIKLGVSCRLSNGWLAVLCIQFAHWNLKPKPVSDQSLIKPGYSHSDSGLVLKFCLLSQRNIKWPTEPFHERDSIQLHWS